MRCRACNKRLNRLESTKKDTTTGDFLDLCFKCLGYNTKQISEIKDIDDEEVLDSILDEFNELDEYDG